MQRRKAQLAIAGATGALHQDAPWMCNRKPGTEDKRIKLAQRPRTEIRSVAASVLIKQAELEPQAEHQAPCSLPADASSKNGDTLIRADRCAYRCMKSLQIS